MDYSKEGRFSARGWCATEGVAVLWLPAKVSGGLSRNRSDKVVVAKKFLPDDCVHVWCCVVAAFVEIDVSSDLKEQKVSS